MTQQVDIKNLTINFGTLSPATTAITIGGNLSTNAGGLIRWPVKLLLPLGFGIGFQLPLVMLFLQRIGIFNIRTYLEKWRIAVLVVARRLEDVVAESTQAF